MLNIDVEKLEKSVADQVADHLIETDHIVEIIRNKVDVKINAIFAESAEAIISDRVKVAINEGFERAYTKVSEYGEKIGSPTTISKELNRIVGEYWSERVDRNGKPTSSNHNTMTRAEYTMTTICAGDFSETMKQSALNVTGALKDGLRNQLAKQMDQLLDELFRVKSLQDQGKVEKPY